MAYDATYKLLKGSEETLSTLAASEGLHVEQVKMFNEGAYGLRTNPPDLNENLYNFLKRKFTPIKDGNTSYFKIYLYGSGVTITDSTTTSTERITMLMFDKEQGTDRTIVASWIYSKDKNEAQKVDHYEVRWEYLLIGTNNGKSLWYQGEKTDISYDEYATNSYSKYTAPSNATQVRIRVKPVSKERPKTISNTGNGLVDGILNAFGNVFINNTISGQVVASVGGVNKEVYFVGRFVTYTYIFGEDPPAAPTGLDVELKDYNLTASLSGIDSNIAKVQFRYVMDNDSGTQFMSPWVYVNAAYASYTWVSVPPGHKYKVQCRLRNKTNDATSEWSDYSENYSSGPGTPLNLTVKTYSKNEVQLDWEAASNAKTYDVQYTKNRDYFDTSSEVQSYTAETNHAIISVPESGIKWFFRVRAVSDANEESAWTDPESITVGTIPTAPTTWSSTATVQAGDAVTLYWIHNSEDSSTETYANLKFTIGKDIENLELENTNGDTTRFYKVSTSGVGEGTTITWKVRTKGAINAYGPWSAERTITVYGKPTVSLVLRNSANTQISTMTSYPLKITGKAGPNTQTPIGYHLSIKSVDAYLTTDDMGNYKFINEGEEVFSKYYSSNNSEFNESLSAGDVNLDNGHSYTVVLTVAMNSGLTGTSEVSFTTSWTETLRAPNAEISLDYLNMSAYIRPYCKDENNNLLEGYSLSVYRREYDGTFIEIAKGLSNTANSVITDPHPSLDYARYRIVSTNDSTGTVSYYDAPGVYFGIGSIIMQWDEQWRSYDSNQVDVSVEPVRTGSMLYLNYNINVSDDYETDASLVKYIGRDYPVSYYGTQKGMTSTWDVEIPKTDKDTLYAIRRLAIWMGNVYIREPSGTGYWARVSVSYNNKHSGLTIPVSFRITRVEGGM